MPLQPKSVLRGFLKGVPFFFSGLETRPTYQPLVQDSQSGAPLIVIPPTEASIYNRLWTLSLLVKSQLTLTTP